MKYRKISPCIWNDAKVRELSDKGKLALLFLLTHPHMTPLGAIRANAPGLACELGWSEKVFRKAFGEVLALGIAKEDAKAPLVWFPNFLRHNMPESPNVVRSWVGAFRDLPESPLKGAMLERTADIIGGSPLATALDVLTEKGLLARTLAIGGMNLPLVLTAAFADADTPLDELEAELTGEAKDQIKRFALGGDEDDDI